MPSQVVDEPAHGERGGNAGDDTPEGDGQGTEDLEHELSAFESLVSGGGAEGDEAEKKAVFGRAGGRKADDIASDDGHHGAAGSGPESNALEEPDNKSLAGGKLVQVGATFGVARSVFPAGFDQEHEKTPGSESENDGEGAEEPSFNPGLQEEAEKNGGKERKDEVSAEEEPVTVAPGNTHEDGEEAVPVEEDDRGDGPGLDDNDVIVDGIAEGVRGAGLVSGWWNFPEGLAIFSEDLDVAVKAEESVGEDKVTG